MYYFRVQLVISAARMSYDGGIEQALEMARKRTLEDPSKDDRWEITHLLGM